VKDLLYRVSEFQSFQNEAIDAKEMPGVCFLRNILVWEKYVFELSRMVFE
jgi:hypothetical protein|tara:strand:- start:598 stop:747 length:150 start_codon:yes stop_codon:yes gene_type:complete